MVELRRFQWVAPNHVLRYLCAIVGYGLRYDLVGEVRQHGYIDSNWAESAMDRNST
jgi:hypothetical protein